MGMYKIPSKQIKFEDFGQPVGMKMSSNNRWVKKAELIPWEEIDYISASVYFNKKIARFAIFTKNNGHFTFSTRNNVKTLQVVGNHFPKGKMYRSPTFLTIIKRGIRYIFDSKYRHKVNDQA